MKNPSHKSRREFMRDASLITTGLATANMTSGCQSLRSFSPDRRLNIGIVGAGGRGFSNLMGVQSENIVALCDVDDERAKIAYEKFPAARRYRDFRDMLAREKSLDAVVVSTPDHNHAIVAIAAMKRGLHVYCEKPLAHSIYEARMMARVAKETGVVTQMGQQGHAMEGSRQAVEVVRSGGIGEVAELHVWTDRPAGWWPQGVARPAETPSIPATLDWNQWLGPAPYRPYHPDYVPFKWRGRWDFGTGPIGDMGVHNLDTAFWALDLGIPTSAEVIDSGPQTEDCPPLWSVMELEYPARGIRPPVKVIFYDGKKLPPEALFHGEEITSNGSLMIGSKGTLYTRTWHGGGENEGDMFALLPKAAFKDYQVPVPFLPRAENHHLEWINACKGGPAAQSDFGYAAKLTEGLLLGFLALRTGKRIEWNPNTMSAVGVPEAAAYVKPTFRKGWEI